MNIFFLDLNPRRAAEYHCNKHVVKMIIETAQLLYSAHWVLESDLPENAYKLAHKNHPCAIWVRQSLENYHWLCCLGWWLCKEYRFRYGDKTHKTEAHIVWLLNNHPNYTEFNFTEPPQAMPVEYKNSDIVKAYQTYYIKDKMKRGFVKYSKREIPKFLI